MQTSSTSRTLCSGKGFTLVELLISIAIIGIVTSLVLVKYGSFDSTVLLKSLAYEIALTLREAQVRSVSVARDAGAGDTGNFDYPFGVTFALSTPKEYTTFRYTITNPTDPNYYPRYGTADAEDIRTFIIPRTMVIQDLCITEGDGTELCLSASPAAFDRLDVSFRRPKFRGLFYADGYGGVQEDIRSAKIEVGSATGFLSFIVEVTSLGQISVYKAP